MRTLIHVPTAHKFVSPKCTWRNAIVLAVPVPWLEPNGRWEHSSGRGDRGLSWHLRLRALQRPGYHGTVPSRPSGAKGTHIHTCGAAPICIPALYRISILTSSYNLSLNHYMIYWFWFVFPMLLTHHFPDQILHERKFPKNTDLALMHPLLLCRIPLSFWWFQAESTDRRQEES